MDVNAYSLKMRKEWQDWMPDNVNVGWMRLAILVAGFLSWPGTMEAEEPLHAGPFFDHFNLTLDQGERTEIGGPFFYSQTNDTERIWAVPPLLSYTRDSGTESLEFDFVYPIITYDRYVDQYRWQFFQLLSFSGG